MVCEAIDSVLAQTYRDFEVIVVDDGSTDNTREVLQKYGDSIRYIYRENGGQCAALNTGLAHARGEYIAFLDSDDLFLPRKIEVQLKGFDRFPNVGMIYSRSYRFDKTPQTGGRRLEEVNDLVAEMQDIFEKMLLLRKAPLIHETLVRRDCFSQVGNFDEKVAVAADHYIWLRVTAHYRVAFVDATVAGYRQHTDQASQAARRQGKYVADLDYILRRVAADLPAMRQTPHVYQSIQRARALLNVERACYTFSADDERRGIERLREALSSGELLREDGEQIIQIVTNYGDAFDAGDASYAKSTGLLHAVWDNLPPRYRYLRKHLRRHLSFRHHDRACLALKRGETIAAAVEAIRWLRYREPWRVPSFVKRALTGAGVRLRRNHVQGL